MANLNLPDSKIDWNGAWKPIKPLLLSKTEEELKVLNGYDYSESPV